MSSRTLAPLAAIRSPLHDAALSRFGNALLVAMAIHGLLVLRWATSTSAPLRAAELRSSELQIEFESEDRPLGATQTTSAAEATSDARPAADELNAAVPSALHPQSTVARAASSAAPLAAATTSDEGAIADGATGDGATGESAIADGDGMALSGSTAPQPDPVASSSAIDLGLDGRLLRLHATDLPKKPPKRRDLGAELERNLSASLAADNVERGFARGNVLVGSLSSSVRTAGPAEGSAVIRITINSLGELSELKLLRGEPSDWTAALQAFREQAKRKRIALPSGSKGLRLTFNVSAKLQRPSGSEVASSAVGVKRPSLAPNGLTFRGDFDVADLSGKTQRMVYAKVLSEEVL